MSRRIEDRGALGFWLQCWEPAEEIPPPAPSRGSWPPVPTQEPSSPRGTCRADFVILLFAGILKVGQVRKDICAKSLHRGGREARSPRTGCCLGVSGAPAVPEAQETPGGQNRAAAPRHGARVSHLPTAGPISAAGVRQGARGGGGGALGAGRLPNEAVRPVGVAKPSHR